jgi:hypothetical protein
MISTPATTSPTPSATANQSSLVISGARNGVVLLACVYPLLLLWVLKSLISPAFEYAGYGWRANAPLSLYAYVILMSVVPACFLPLKGERPGSVVLWIMYVVAYVPIQALPLFASGRSISELFPLHLCVLLGLFIMTLMSRRKPVSIGTAGVSATAFWSIIYAFSIASLVAAISAYGVPDTLPSLGDVYDVRAEFKESNTAIHPIVLYMLSWQQKVVNPLMIAYGFARKRYGVLCFGLAGQMLLFGINGQKSVFFSAVMVVAVLFANRRNGFRLGLSVMLGIVSLVVVTAALDIATSTTGMTSLLVRRLLFTPGILTGYYYDFFSANPFILLSNSILSGVVDYPYERGVATLIGSVYLDRPDTAANANIWADGFAQFGYVGILVFSLILGFVIWCFNSLAAGRNLAVTSSLAGISAWTLTDTALFTSLNTHGILFSILVLYLLPLDSGESESEGKSQSPINSSNGASMLDAPLTSDRT